VPRLLRLRSWLRSRSRPRLTANLYTPHAPVNLLPPQYLADGTLPARGSETHSASIIEKARGTRTQVTATTAAFSFSSLHGWGLVAKPGQTSLPLANSSTGRGSSGSETGTPGASGVPLERAV
jgi:hypothetical protein